MEMSKICRKRKLRTSQALIVLNLPDDIIAIILSRLPVKSLLKFKCVSKSWYSLISSKQFVKAHLQMSTKNTNFTNHSIIVAGSLLPSALDPIIKQSLPYEPCTYAFEHHSLPYIGSSWRPSLLMSCCNGLCCVLIPGKEGIEFLLWNPSTRKSMKFQKMEMGTTCTFSGFGFDESNDDYKILVGMVPYSAPNSESVVHLYSLKSNSRKRIDHPFKGKGGDLFCPLGTFVNGKLHWLMRNNDNVNNFGLDIVCFDMETEMYGGAVEQPPDLDRRFNPTLGVLGGCLSVVSANKENRKDIWVLKKYGVKESWEKVASIPSGKPLCITPEGEIMLNSGQSFGIYDPKRDTDRQIINSPVYFLQLNVCVQSLVSPFL